MSYYDIYNQYFSADILSEGIFESTVLPDYVSSKVLWIDGYLYEIAVKDENIWGNSDLIHIADTIPAVGQTWVNGELVSFTPIIVYSQETSPDQDSDAVTPLDITIAVPVLGTPEVSVIIVDQVYPVDLTLFAPGMATPAVIVIETVDAVNITTGVPILGTPRVALITVKEFSGTASLVASGSVVAARRTSFNTQTSIEIDPSAYSSRIRSFSGINQVLDNGSLKAGRIRSFAGKASMLVNMRMSTGSIVEFTGLCSVEQNGMLTPTRIRTNSGTCCIHILDQMTITRRRWFSTMVNDISVDSSLSFVLVRGMRGTTRIPILNIIPVVSLVRGFSGASEVIAENTLHSNRVGGFAGACSIAVTGIGSFVVLTSVNRVTDWHDASSTIIKSSSITMNSRS